MSLPGWSASLAPDEPEREQAAKRVDGPSRNRDRGGEDILMGEFAYGVVRQLFEVPLASAGREDRERWLAGAASLAAPLVSASAPVHGAAGTPSILHAVTPNRLLPDRCEC